MKRCQKCNARMPETSRFCPMCGRRFRKSKVRNSIVDIHHNKVLFKFVIPVLIIGSLVFAYLLYSYFGPGLIESDVFTTSQVIYGDGEQIVEIPIKVKNIFGTYMSYIHVDAKTDIGLITTCTTDESGECLIRFKAPKTPIKEIATIELSAGFTQKQLEFEIRPDPVAKISMNLDKNKIPADGMSVAEIEVEVLNKNDDFVADGTIVSLSTNPNVGTIQDNCITSNGKCFVEFISDTNPGKVEIIATSFGIKVEKTIEATKLPATKIEIEPTIDSLVGDSESSTIVNIRVLNSIDKPVANEIVYFEAVLGTIDESCITGSDGKCSVKYVAGYTPGDDTIKATSGETISSAPIQLLGFSSLDISLKFDQFLGEDIVPAFALNHEYLNENMIEATIINEGTEEFIGTISASIEGWSDEQKIQFRVDPFGIGVIELNPPLKEKAFTNYQTQNAQYRITVEDNSDEIIYQNNFPVDILSANNMQWHLPYLGESADRHNNLITAWVNPDSNKVRELIVNAAKRTPTNSILGYQTYSTGCGDNGNEECSQAESTYIQAKALYEELQNSGFHYINTPGNFFTTGQTVFTPFQTLDLSSANCIDGSLVFASAFVSMGMQTYITIVPGHAFVCVRESYTSDFITCIETTVIGSGASFDEATSSATQTFNQYYSDDQINIIDINAEIANGIKPIPTPN